MPASREFDEDGVVVDASLVAALDDYNLPDHTGDEPFDIPDYGGMTLEQIEVAIRKDVRAFVRVGLALGEVCNRRMYKPTYACFDDYCRNVWGWCRQTAHRSIDASEIALELSPIGDIQGAIMHESQLRPLAKLPNADLRREAFVLAVKGSATGQPTAGQVKAAVNDVLLRERVNAARLADGTPPDHLGHRAKIIHGDTADPGLIAPASVNLIIGSPPYNLGVKYPTVDDALQSEEYLAKMRTWLVNCHRWLVSEGGRLCLNVPIDTRKFGPFPVAAELTKIAQEVGFAYETTTIWDEGSHKGYWNQVDPVAVPQIFCRCEAILIFSKGGMKRSSTSHLPDITREEVAEWSSGYWRFAGAHTNNVHPCRFPPELPRRLIKLLSYPHDVILDPWAGSGTTLLEAIELNRQAIGIEIEKQYLDLIQRRLETISTPTARSTHPPLQHRA